MVTYCVTQIMTVCSQRIVQCFDTIMVELNNKQLETILSHLNRVNHCDHQLTNGFSDEV